MVFFFSFLFTGCVMLCMTPENLETFPLKHVCLFISFSFALHICYQGTVPAVLSQIFHNSNCNNHHYGNSLKMLCCFRSGEDNKPEREGERRFFFSFSVFWPSVIHPCFKSITHTRLRIPRSHQKWNRVNVIFPANSALDKKNQAALSEIIHSNNMSDFSLSETMGFAACLQCHSVFINSC